MVVSMSYLRQVHIRDDDLVQSTRRILPWLSHITVWVVLILGVGAGVPWLTVFRLGDLVLGG